jgi:hypothetical protein
MAVHLHLNLGRGFDTGHKVIAGPWDISVDLPITVAGKATNARRHIMFGVIGELIKAITKAFEA